MARKQKAKFTLRVELIAMLLVVVAMITTVVVIQLPSASEKLQDKYVKEGSSLVADHVFVEVSRSELVSLIESGDQIFVYYGSHKCSTCVTEISTIDTAAKRFDVEVVYYLNSDFSDGDREEDAKHDQMLNDWEAKLKGVNLSYTPSIWVYENKDLTFDSGSYMDEETEELLLNWGDIATRAFALNKEELVD